MTAPTTKIKSLLDRIERVETSKLKVHPRNPRRGDVDRIAQSLEANSQYRPIVVQQKTSYIIAGNHTYLGARKLGWTHLDVVYVDVNDKQARKIMLADNRTSDSGSYDKDILAEVLASLEGDVEGSGYYDDEIDNILSGASQAAETTLQDFSNTELQRRFNDSPLGSEDEDEVLESDERGPADFGGQRELAGADHLAEDEDDPSLEAAKDSLGGIKRLADPSEVDFPKIGYWEITELDQRMLMRWEDIPQNLFAWGESYSREGTDPAVHDPSTWYLYNWGMSSSKGMPNLEQVILGFYSPDDTFECWWSYPERYTSKLLNSGIKFALGPDFSIEGADPRVIHLHQLYRQRWLSRYLQEAGVKVCPNISGSVTDLDFYEKYVLGTLPVGIPLVSCQFQTFNKDDIAALGEEAYVKYFQLIFDKLEPEGFILYAGRPGQEFFKSRINTRNTKVRIIDSRLMRLNDLDKLAPKSRGRKSTI